MKISKKVRAAAIHVLDLGAGSRDFCAGSHHVYEQAPDYPGLNHPFEMRRQPIVWLVWAAWCRIPSADSASCAAAAGLLRDGWSPGEDVVYIRPEDL